MFSKNVSVTCPYCGAVFSIPVGANYQNAEALTQDKGGKSGIKPGINTICPNPRCYRDIFIHYVKY
jgi:ribosomal protein S27E